MTTYEEEQARIAAAADPATNGAFDRITQASQKVPGLYNEMSVQMQTKIDAFWDTMPGESERGWAKYPPRERARLWSFVQDKSLEDLRRLGDEARREATDSGARRESAGADLFRRYTMLELLSEPDDFEWLVRGLLAQPTYGQIAGELKTLKSYIAGFVAVGMAGGVPIFDRFVPAESRPVVTYVGEGGRKLWQRRIRRISAAMGVSADDLDLHPSFDVAPIPSLVFQESLRRDLDEIGPGLVLPDPLYAYHGAETKASDLHQEGALLNLLSKPCMDVGASLLVVNHFNQTGTGSSLKRITMAGSGEWADSWLLLEHREAPDVENGLFRLRLDIGSRQWGGTTWDLDLDIGRFDEETGSHDGQITWDLNRARFGGTTQDRTAGTEKASKRITDTIADHPFEMTKTEIRTAVGGNRDAFDRAFDALAQSETIAHHQRGRAEAGTTKKRLLWGLEPISTNGDGPGWVRE